jgi:serine/threonine protein kinase
MLSPLGSSDPIARTRDPLVGLPYRAIRQLGAGGMGEVYLAEHRKLGRLCVAKILHASLARDPILADRIRIEGESLGLLNHPHIVSIIGAGQTLDERPFIIMEYLRGQSLADELAVRGQLPVIEALGYTCQLLRALAAAHAIGIVHRDIKPDNLFLCEGCEGNRTLKVLDFGVARIMPEALLSAPHPLAAPTDPGMVVGTPRYVSPEGALGRRVDHRADLYSAILVLYAAVAGRGPFDHIQSPLLLLSAHAAEDPEPPSRFSREHVPLELDRVILRGLQKRPDERFQTADELREELEQIIGLLRRSSECQETRAFGVHSQVDSPFEAASDTDVSEPSSPTSVEHQPERKTSQRNVVLVFLSSAVVAAAAAAGFIALLRGAR